MKRKKKAEPRFKDGDQVWVVVNNHDVKPATVKGALLKDDKLPWYMEDLRYAVQFRGDIHMTVAYESAIYLDPTRPNTTKTENYQT